MGSSCFFQAELSIEKVSLDKHVEGMHETLVTKPAFSVNYNSFESVSTVATSTTLCATHTRQETCMRFEVLTRTHASFPARKHAILQVFWPETCKKLARNMTNFSLCMQCLNVNRIVKPDIHMFIFFYTFKLQYNAPHYQLMLYLPSQLVVANIPT